ncbi:DASH complex subunit Dad1-domain-containing protein [Durotheca rogersii]|uniref:DASH complex subunit Dad1-domain-containing protein n=1 Tax=Durotheca rogersii TaxID=419775 RepID=UPI00221E5D04|nr:DASH complex subunit Dad1-domain-containing protein [Durotheca rogersii]KAI5863576.1 DASH complex subunit Dad1-domain-containing protein [Durotheca rogersii]
MSSSHAAATATPAPGGSGGSRSSATREKTYFEQQREAVIGEIAMSFEQVLASINKLNRAVEAVVAVGNEFASVEALWSQFEGVMAAAPADEARGAGESAPPPPPPVPRADAETARRQKQKEEQEQEEQGADDESSDDEDHPPSPTLATAAGRLGRR